MFQNPKM